MEGRRKPILVLKATLAALQPGGGWESSAGAHRENPKEATHRVSR